MFADATIAVPNIQAGKVIALGTSAAKQTELMPSVPPIAALCRIRWEAWQGIVAPAATPKEIVDRLAQSWRRSRPRPSSSNSCSSSAWIRCRRRRPSSCRHIKAEQPRWVKAIKDSGAKVD